MTSLSEIPPKHDLRSDGPMATVKMSVNRKLLLFVEPQQITIIQGISFSREQQATLEAGFTKIWPRDEGVLAFLSGIREIVTTKIYVLFSSADQPGEHSVLSSSKPRNDLVIFYPVETVDTVHLSSDEHREAPNASQTGYLTSALVQIA